MTPDEIKFAVATASDRTFTVLKVEDITEPKGKQAGCTRVVLDSQKSVSIGWEWRTTYEYVNPPSSPAWGALSGTADTLIRL